MSLLELRNVTRRFGGLTAVDELSMSIDRGGITGLIGPNGAGKTTAFNLITGLIQPDSGQIVFNGHDIVGLPSYMIAKKGLAKTYQHARVFKKMTVEENLLVVPSPVDDSEKEADRLISLVQMEEERESMAGELSGGQQMLVGLARTLMLNPDLILLDEPFAGVNPGLADDIVELLKNLRDEQDVTILLISHEINQITRLCDDVIVMLNGSNLIKDRPEVVQNDERVIQAYLGDI